MTRVRPAFVYALLALAVAGPLLAPGLVLAVDLPLVPHPHLPSVYWGLPTSTHGGPVDRLPIDLLFVGLGHIGAVAIGEKAMLLAIVFLAGFGMHRIAPSRSGVGRYFAGLLYAVNPFVYDRLDSGEWYLLLGYALLPWAFAALLPLGAGEWRRAWRFAAIATLIGIASPHMLALLGVLVVAVTLTAVNRSRRRARSVGAIALGCVLTGLASLYWLIPAPGLTDLWNHVGSAQLRLYETVADHTWGVAGAVLGLYGYWNDPTPIKSYLAAWPLIAAALIALALWGLVSRRRDPVSWAVAAAAGFGFLLALGTRSTVTGSLFHSLVDDVAPLRSFREPQKGVALLAFGYAYLGAAAAGELREHATQWWPRRVAVALAASVLILPVLGGYRELGGLWGALQTSAYPGSWAQARAQLDREATTSRTLVVPWHGYFALSFAGHRVVGNPAAAYFDTPVLVSRSVGEGAAGDNSDPLDATVASLLAGGPSRHDLGACLAVLGVSHVLVAKEADWASYAFLGTQRDLVVERRWSDLVLYRNVHPTSLTPRVTHVGRGLCDTRVAPLTVRPTDPAHLRLATVPARGTLVALASPGGGTWSLGSSPPGRIGTAVDLFAANGQARTFALAGWTEIRRNYAFGAIGTLLAVALAAAGRLGRKRRVAEALSDAGRLWVVLPTYNEASNLTPMVERLLGVFDEHRLDGTILVVDDASPDGTGRIADELAAAHPAVRVLHRGAKTGIGRAYVDGFAVALRAGADVVVQMDCDFSHDPADVPRLVEALARSHVVLGSRYVRGGRVERWGLGRRILSRLGCLYAQCVLRVPVRDLTGGFKCFRADALRSLSLGSIGANGYAFQIETTYRALAEGLVVHEVPIVFRDRTVGESKMSWRIAAEAVALVPRLRIASRRDVPARGRLPRREPGRPELAGAGVEVGKQRTQVV